MEGMKAQADYGLKERELALKEFEAQKPGDTAPDPRMQWEYDMQMAREKMAFEAEQAALDRQADLAKALLSKDDNDAERASAEAVEMLRALVAASAAMESE